MGGMNGGWHALVWALVLASTSIASVASAQVTATVEAVGRDETDGSDVGWNSQYPSPSFDDEATRRGLPNAVWEGSHRLEPGRICLMVRNLRSPYPPTNTLSLGYRVRLSGAVFDDGTSERTIEMHRFSGTPSPAPIERCLAIRSSGATAGGSGVAVPVPSGVGAPGSGLSGPACHGLWGLGVQFGFAEHAATYDDSPAMLTQSLTYARDLAAQSGCLPTGEIEALRQRMASAPSSRPLFDSILALRQRYATIVQQQCACGGGGGQAAHGVWGVGVQMGYAEYGSGRDASTATLTQSFDYALQLGTASQCLPLTEIQDLRGRMASAPRSRPLYDSILAMRLRYASIVQQQCACGPIAATPPPPATCSPACGRGTTCVSGTCVGTGTLGFTLTWDRPGDVDLHVLTPAGHDIHYAGRQADGGELDHDDTSGTGPENVFWSGAPPPGRYLVCVTGYRVGGPTSFTLTVNRSGMSPQTFTGTRSASTGNRTCARDSADFVTEVQIGGAGGGGPAPSGDPLAASSWRGERREQCNDSPFGGPTDETSSIAIQTRRLSATQLELSVSRGGHLERTIVTTAPGAASGTVHTSEGDHQRDVTVSFRDGRLHYVDESVFTEVDLHCRATAVLAPGP